MDPRGRQAAPDQDEGVSPTPELPREGEGPAVSRHSPLQAPEVTREWPAEEREPLKEPTPWPFVLMAGLLALVLMGLVPGRLLTTPVGLVVTASLAGLCAVAFHRSLMVEDPADRALRRAQRAIWLDEDPRGIVVRLRGVDLRGRPRLRRDIALRCLERARRCERLDRSMRYEAARWLGRAREELRKEMR